MSGISADIDEHGWCLANGGSQVQCAPLDDFSTSDLASFVTSMAKFVHFSAPGMLVSSGFALPRPAAWHLSQRPGWSSAGPDWTPDTPAELAENIATLHQGLDIVSVHVYPGDVRFGRPAGSEGQTVDDVAAIAHALGKKLYVGEFGDSSVTPYMTSMLQHFASSHVDYASVWAFEFYQFAPYQFAAGYNLDPEFTPGVDAFLQQQIGTAPPAPAGPQRVMINWPVPCSSFDPGQPIDVYALASGPGGIGNVQFLVDGTPITSVTAPPYHATIVVPKAEVAQIRAVASGPGQPAVSTIQVAVGVSPAGCAIPPLDPVAGIGNVPIAAAAQSIPQMAEHDLARAPAGPHLANMTTQPVTAIAEWTTTPAIAELGAI